MCTNSSSGGQAQGFRVILCHPPSPLTHAGRGWSLNSQGFPSYRQARQAGWPPDSGPLDDEETRRGLGTRGIDGIPNNDSLTGLPFWHSWLLWPQATGLRAEGMVIEVDMQACAICAISKRASSHAAKLHADTYSQTCQASEPRHRSQDRAQSAQSGQVRITPRAKTCRSVTLCTRIWQAQLACFLPLDTVDTAGYTCMTRWLVGSP